MFCINKATHSFSLEIPQRCCKQSDLQRDSVGFCEVMRTLSPPWSIDRYDAGIANADSILRKSSSEVISDGAGFRYPFQAVAGVSDALAQSLALVSVSRLVRRGCVQYYESGNHVVLLALETMG